MIEKLRLQNFQKHTDAKLKLGRVTCVVGESDRGKSSIIRAIRWLMLNQPAGDSVRKHDTKQTTVTAWIDGKRVERGKGRENVYRLEKAEYKAFGNKVPEGIATFLNVGDENFQCQHDSPFLLHLSSGQISRSLNSVVDLEAIDETQQRAARKVRQCKQQHDSNQQQRDDYRQQITEHKWAVKASKLVERYDKVADDFDLLESKLSRLRLLQKRIGDVEAERRVIDDKLRLAAAEVVLAKLHSKRDQLLVIQRQLTNTQTELEDTTQEAKCLAKKIRKATSRRCPVCGRGEND